MAKRLQKNRPPPVVVSHDGKKSEGKFILQALLIAAACLWIYWPALRGDWLWDDDLLIAQNPIVHDPSGWWRIWFEPGQLLDYQPIKFSVAWLQWQLWGGNTLGYHLTNVVLHATSALLVWRLLAKFHLRLAWLGGLIFAVHPVQVESVAWMAELKNTLSLPPFLLAMCAYLDYDEREKAGDYRAALGWFLVALLCKSTMVMFPVVILLHAWWKRNRIAGKDLKACAPFFGLSLGMGLVTVWFLQHHAIGQDAVPMGGFFSRLACAGLAISFYFTQCFWPIDLLPLYPRWTVDPPVLWQFLPWPILAGVAYWLWTKRNGWGRGALLGLGFFLINLTPFLGFNVASYMAFTWVMDHLLYLPIIGLIGLVVAGLERLEDRLPRGTRPLGTGLLTLALLFLAWGSREYAGIFLNQTTFWSYTIERTPDSWQAHNYLGYALGQSGQDAAGIAELKEALRLKPDYFEAHSNLGSSLLQMGDGPGAIEQFEQALRLRPDSPKAHDNLGNALSQTGRAPEATAQYEQALRLDPDDAEAQNNLGFVQQQAGHLPEAMQLFSRILKSHPDNLNAHCNLGNALYQSGRLPEAIEQFQRALRLKPDNAETHYNLANALLNLGQAEQAIGEFEQAIKFRPAYAEAHSNLGVAFLNAGRIPESTEELRRALQIKPDYFEARYNLGLALIREGREAEARDEFAQALKLNPDDSDTKKNLARLDELLKNAPPR